MTPVRDTLDHGTPEHAEGQPFAGGVVERVDAGDETNRPTIRTVAARAGVSKSLVSLVLQQPSKVGPERRAAVLRAMDELGYVPPEVVRRPGRPHGTHPTMVGIFLSDLRQPWFADLLDGLTPSLYVAGHRPLLADGRYDNSVLDETSLRSFVDLGVDGLILAGTIAPSPAVVAAVTAIPTVAVGGLDLDLDGVDVVATDNEQGARLAVEHLASLGHRRIAHIRGSHGEIARHRLRGYQKAMADLGLGDGTLVETSDMTEEGGYRAAVRLLRGSGAPTAVFAANDLSCLGALSAASELGLSVPGDVSLVGFDNSSLARLRAVWMTSVDGAGADMGRRAVSALSARISRRDRTSHRVDLVAPHLEVRGTTGPASTR